jgi:hypothetical protein
MTKRERIKRARQIETAIDRTLEAARERGFLTESDADYVNGARDRISALLTESDYTDARTGERVSAAPEMRRS